MVEGRFFLLVNINYCVHSFPSIFSIGLEDIHCVDETPGCSTEPKTMACGRTGLADGARRCWYCYLQFPLCFKDIKGCLLTFGLGFLLSLLFTSILLSSSNNVFFFFSIFVLFIGIVLVVVIPGLLLVCVLFLPIFFFFFLLFFNMKRIVFRLRSSWEALA